MRSDEDEVHALLRHLDHPMPRVDVRDVMQRAQPRRWSDVGRAAGILMMLGVAGAAWAAPGSPVSGWIAKVVARVGRPSNIKAVTAVQAIAPVAIPAVSASAKPRMSGVAVAPGAKLAISFTASQPVGELRISLASVADVSVRTADPAATFTSSDGQL